MNAVKFKSKRGQNTAEYMLLLLLIGGGSIMAFKTFGKGIINRFANVTSLMTGNGVADSKKVTDSLTEAKDGDVNFKSFEDNAQKK